MTATKPLKKLNEYQQQAVDTIDGPVMVVAGPGTGKTELLSRRVANILQKTDTLPESILCLTFTDSGAAAMRERLVGIIGKDAYKVAIHTFHSFGGEVISHNREYFYNNAAFELADDIKKYEILHAILSELGHDNPLTSTMNGEFVHLRDIQKAISDLKRTSALSHDELLAVLDQNEAALDTVEPLLAPIFEQRISKTTAASLIPLQTQLADIAVSIEPLYETVPLLRIVAETLGDALIAATGGEKLDTKPITQWKNAHFERNDAKELVMKDRKKLAKLKSLSNVYFQYLSQMQQQGLYDFDDMIMQVVHAVETHDDLRYNLQEKYLYIMVDEFQDTNLAQMRILHSLTDNPVNEGNPNILVVGDDDQAIYGFQGADVSNILSFSDTYPGRELIVLTENYRSHTPILEASRQVITQAGDRLEQRIPELKKNLTAAKGEGGIVSLYEAPSLDDERYWVVQQIAENIKNGTAPQEIAVLARRHKDIQALLPYFTKAGIPVRYEHQENVLEQESIVALETVARTVMAIAEGQHDPVETLLPRLLAHPAWNISPKDLWQLSLDAYASRQNWMSVMATTPAFVTAHEWLVTRAAEVADTPLEVLLDRLFGPDDEAKSPYFAYYFSSSVLEASPNDYLAHLTALRSIRAKLREHQPNTTLVLKDFLSFIDLHRRLDIAIKTSVTTLASDEPAVQLLTAHKAKGLEYETVYVINSIDSNWGFTTREPSPSISFPVNLPIGTLTGSTIDERLRLYYVAMTRAYTNLILTFSTHDTRGKDTLVANFLVDSSLESRTVPALTDVGEQEAAELAWYSSLVTPSQDLNTLLAPRLETYKLSATALNSFTDLTHGGPTSFLLRSLLHFPEAKSPQSIYGTAIHRTLQIAHTHVIATGEQKPLEDILHDFEAALTAGRLTDKEQALYLQKGSEDLTTFIESGVMPFLPTQKAEVSFGNQDAYCGPAHLTGSLDLIEIDSSAKEIIVTDYKTGHPAQQWSGGSVHEKVKLHKYRQQLIFYKILIENSREFNTYTATAGQLAFIEPTKSGQSVVLSTEFSTEEVERTKLLIGAVWKRIITLDFPDVSGYSEDLAGILQFEQDLIDETV